MELKSKRKRDRVIFTLRSNRTFMELKFCNLGYADMAQCCSNRTFMELKWVLIFAL